MTILEFIVYILTFLFICYVAHRFNEDRCKHCGKRPEADGDHNCPCPYSDADCPNH